MVALVVSMLRLLEAFSLGDGAAGEANGEASGDSAAGDVTGECTVGDADGEGAV